MLARLSSHVKPTQAAVQLGSVAAGHERFETTLNFSADMVGTKKAKKK